MYTQIIHPSGVASLGLSEGEYHYSISSIFANTSERGQSYENLADRFAVISSDDVIRVFSLDTVTSNIANHDAEKRGVTVLGKHHKVSCIAPLPANTGAGWMTAGQDCSIQQWDHRRQGSFATASSSVWNYANNRKAPYLSIASQSDGFLWASGTELTSSIAEVQIWDLRKMASPMISYTECHNDDVCVLTFTSALPSSSTLLSGSTDGLVNIYSSDFPTEEDDALMQVINHGSSIHQAGFIPRLPHTFDRSEATIYAVSHDETLSVYQREYQTGGDEESPRLAFGDVRGLLQCEYIIDVIHSSSGAIIAAGSHSEKRVDLMALTYSQSPSFHTCWDLKKEPRFRLEGGHGEDIIRSLIKYDRNNKSIFLTAGEDGRIRAWETSYHSEQEDEIMEDEDTAATLHFQKEQERSTQVKRKKERFEERGRDKQRKTS